jgi:hypothetical protein
MIAQQLHQKLQMQERFIIRFEFNNWGGMGRIQSAPPTLLLCGRVVLVLLVHPHHRIRECFKRTAMSGHDLVKHACNVPPIAMLGGIPPPCRSSIIAIMRRMMTTSTSYLTPAKFASWVTSDKGLISHCSFQAHNIIMGSRKVLLQ